MPFNNDVLERARLLPREAAASVLSLHALAAAYSGGKRAGSGLSGLVRAAPISPVRVGQPVSGHAIPTTTQRPFIKRARSL